MTHHTARDASRDAPRDVPASQPTHPVVRNRTTLLTKGSIRLFAAVLDPRRAFENANRLVSLMTWILPMSSTSKLNCACS